MGTLFRVEPFATNPVSAGADGKSRTGRNPMAMWFTITHDKDGYRARLWSGSDRIWWTEGYERKTDALNAIRIAKASHIAPVYDRTQRAA